MKFPITNLHTLRQLGRNFNLFDVPKPHNHEGRAYALGRNWLVIREHDLGNVTRYKCQAIKVQMLCGVRIVTPFDGGDPVCH